MIAAKPHACRLGTVILDSKLDKRRKEAEQLNASRWWQVNCIYAAGEWISRRYCLVERTRPEAYTVVSSTCCEKTDRPLRAKVQMLDQILHEPCFDQLRTKEQLGYIVYCGYYTSFTTHGLYFTIQSEKTATYLDSRIENFLETMATTLAEMSSEEFEKNKRSLVDKLLEKSKDLEQESNKHWGHIDNEYYAFDSGRHPCVTALLFS